MPIRLAIIGFGKIARDEHVPAIATSTDFELVAVAGPGADNGPVRGFETHWSMLADLQGRIDAVAICTPPIARYEIACDCLTAGLHVLLEKPPAATLGEMDELQMRAVRAGRSLFAAWHARYNPAVLAAAALLSGQHILSLEIEWREDVRKWHPGQSWIWDAGGFGVFDPGINALSIATMICPTRLLVERAEFVIPQNVQAPIAASVIFSADGEAGRWRATLDWRATRPPTATLVIRTHEGNELALRQGGSSLYLNGEPAVEEGNTEYAQIYDRFARLIEASLSDADREPLRLVADTFLVAKRCAGEPFLVG